MRTRFLCRTYRIAFALLFFLLIAYLIRSHEGGVSNVSASLWYAEMLLCSVVRVSCIVHDL